MFPKTAQNLLPLHHIGLQLYATKTETFKPNGHDLAHVHVHDHDPGPMASLEMKKKLMNPELNK